MFENVLPPRSRELLDRLIETDLLEPFYLAGGTAVALQLGHRLSEDLDFFSGKGFDPLRLESRLAVVGNLKVVGQEEGTLISELDGVKVSWLEYPYPLLGAAEAFSNVAVACLLDIGLMKLTAIFSRGSKRDFFDVKVICDEIGELNGLLDAMPRKYKGIDFSLAHLLKSLVYFDDAEAEPEPKMLIDLDWPEVKRFFEEQVKELVKKDE